MTAPMDIKEAAKVLRRHNEWRRGADDNHWQQSPYSPAELGHAIDAAVAALEVADRFRPSMDVCGFVGNEFTNKTTGKRWRFDGQSWIEMPPREAFDAAILRRQGERTMSQPDDLLREAVALARMAQMFRRVGGVMPGVKEMLDSLVSDADAFLAKFDAAKGEVPEGFTLVENKALSTARMALAHATTTHGELYRDAYESLLAASKGEK